MLYVDVPPETVKTARDLTTRAHETGVSAGYDPAGFAVGCLKVAGDLANTPLVQADLASAAAVSAWTAFVFGLGRRSSKITTHLL